MSFDSVSDWLAWQESLNPRGIALGLERCLPVAHAMGLVPPLSPLVSVAGTNGKGSCVCLLESILSRAGYRVGSYTSPYLKSFNETIRIAGQAVDDDVLIGAFQRVEAARAGIALTCFEFRTIAAALILRDANVDLTVMEIGLGGRLDAVNLFDAELALVTSIGMDHTDWLGQSRDEIGREKAGILRRGRPAVCGDPAPPEGFLEAAKESGARLYRAGVDYRHESSDDAWDWYGPGATYRALPMPGIPGACQRDNAAAVLMVIELIKARFPVTEKAFREGVARCALAGRQEVVPGCPETILDVAHNPDAAEALAEALRSRPCSGQTRAVLGAYADKDIEGVARSLRGQVDAWYVAALPAPRGASCETVAAALDRAGVMAAVSLHSNVAGAITAARGESACHDRIVVFGSFETVRETLRLES